MVIKQSVAEIIFCRIEPFLRNMEIRRYDQKRNIRDKGNIQYVKISHLKKLTENKNQKWEKEEIEKSLVEINL